MGVPVALPDPKEILPSILDNDHRVNGNGWHPYFKKIVKSLRGWAGSR
jgi:hypothetical protein